MTKKHLITIGAISLILGAAILGYFAKTENLRSFLSVAAPENAISCGPQGQTVHTPSTKEEGHSYRPDSVLPPAIPQQREQQDGRVNVGTLIDIPEDAFSVLPPLRNDCVVVYLTEPSRLPPPLFKKGRLIEDHYFLLPLDVASQFESLLREHGIVMPVFGFGEDRLFLTASIIVRFDADKTEQEIADIMGATGATSYRTLSGPPNLYSFTFPESSIPDTLSISWYLSQRSDIRYAEPNWLALVKPTSADPFFDQQWGLHNTGQVLCDPVPGIVPNSDVDAPEAWEITLGSTNVFVAVLDNGVEWDHPDIALSMAPTNVWHDAVDDDADPRPSIGDYHGTSIAGIIAASQSNSLGVTGVAPGCRVMPVRIAYGSGNEWVMQTEWAVEGIGWAWQNGASVLNLSWAMESPLTSLHDALTTALTSGRSGKGCVVVAAAGNDNLRISGFPASLPEILTVGASSPADERKSPSSVDGETFWGSSYHEPLDCVAPGVKIYTTDPTGSTGKSTNDYNCRFNGTSAAAPFASAIAALVLSVDGSLSQEEVVSIMTKSAERVGGYSYQELKTNGVWDAEMGYGRLNAHRAAAMAQGVDYDLPRLEHVQLPAQTNTGLFVLDVDISDSTGIDAGANAPCLYYRTVGEAWTSTTDTNGPDGSAFSFVIPFVPLGFTVEYYFAAQDSSPQHNMITLPCGGSGTSPPETTAPSTVFSFLVGTDPGLPVLYVDVSNASSLQLGTIENPFTSIQQAVDKENTAEIRVACGVYTAEDAESVIVISGGMKHVRILGGYTSDFSSRNPEEGTTTIDGQSLRRGIQVNDNATLELDGFRVTNGLAPEGGGIQVMNSAVLKAKNCIINGNSCSPFNVNYRSGGGIFGGSYACIVLEDCIITNNTVVGDHNTSHGGGINVITPGTVLRMTNCIVRGNSAEARGGGIHIHGGVDVRCTGCVITDNTTGSPYPEVGYGGGVYIEGFYNPNVEFINCTITRNYADVQGGGIAARNHTLTLAGRATLTLKNCIVYGNSGNQSSTDLFVGEKTDAVTRYCNLGGVYVSSSATLSEEQTVTNDPAFLREHPSTLSSDSPCIDAGNNSDAPTGTDLNNNPRIIGGTVDMGAYEFYVGTNDFDVDGIPNQWENEYFGNITNADEKAVCSNGVNTVRQAYIAGLNPNDPDAAFLTSILSGKILQWNAVSGRVYSVYWTTNLLSGFECLESNIPWTQCSLTNTLNVPSGYYKIDVRLE